MTPFRSLSNSRERARVALLSLPIALALAACGPQTAADSAPPEDGDPARAVVADASDETAGPQGAATATDAVADGMSEFPALKIATLDHGEFDLVAKRGRWVVVNFWATWCAPCLKEMPELDGYDAKRDDVEVIGLAYEETTPEDMRAFLKKVPVKYPIAIVDTYAPPVDFPTPRGLPMTYLIAPDGRVAADFIGPVTGKDLDAAIAAHRGDRGSASGGAKDGAKEGAPVGAAAGAEKGATP